MAEIDKQTLKIKEVEKEISTLPINFVCMC